MNTFMNPQKGQKGLKDQEKEQPWNFIECEKF
jgi:hypothetical protein